MPVRSIKLKLVVPRTEAGRGLRASLWTTHEEVNAATRYYEQWLLVLRGLPYETAARGEQGGGVSADAIRAQALAAARAAQLANLERSGHQPEVVGTDDEVLDAMHQLFQLIAPDETGAASAQAANAYLSPLVDPESKGFGAAADKLERPRPNWLTLQDDDPALLEAATAWFASDTAASWRGDTGSPAAWLRAARAGKPNWPALFRTKLEELARVGAEGPEAAVARLRALHLLPFFPAYFPPRMVEAQGGVTPWDRLAMRLAASHILSWQAWVRRAADQHAARVATLEAYRTRAVTPAVAALLPQVAAYERARGEALGKLGLGPAEYRLLPRQLRGWSDLREAWLRVRDPSPDRLRTISAEHQTRMRGRFGDPHVFLWLAERQQHEVWQADDVPTIAATLNAMQNLVDRSRETATMTLPDAQLHPRATQWSAEGDSNLRPYRLLDAGDGALKAELSLLCRGDDGRLEDVRPSFHLAASGQLRDVRLIRRGKKAELAFANDAGQRFTGVLGSADLLFDRDHLGHRDHTELARGDIGSVWLKLAVDLDAQLPEGWEENHARFTRHFAAGLGKATKAEDSVRAGVRVLAVDLGIRTFAACSVFELRDQVGSASSAKARLAFPVPIGNATLWAVHERSFDLSLPDEEPTAEGAAWRTLRRAELQQLRRALSLHRRALRLVGVEVPDRSDALDALKAALAEGDHLPPAVELHAELERQMGVPQPVWNDAVATALRGFRSRMSPFVRKWRRTARERQPFTYLGKSMWAIEYLTDTRRLLMTWSLLGRVTGEIRRLDRAGRGTFAANLLGHLDRAKEDRLKTGADLIVRAALGYVRDHAGRWEQRFAPCDAVLFEDLSRYRMRTDRPRRENSQLMRWAHRGVPAEVTMQGELHGLGVVETGAAFSSRYHARTMTPGVRCRPLAASDMGDAFLREALLEDGIILEQCRPGDLVPRAGGEIFACVSAAGGLIRLDADINAAQNLQRRFWTRHAAAFRLPCVPAEVGGKDAWVPRQMGKRLLGALGGYGVLRPTGHESGSCRWERVRAAAVRGTATSDGDVTSDLEGEELAGLAEEAEAAAGRVEVFFRDPSGVILPEALWYPSKTFWSIVRAKTLAGLKARLGLVQDTM